MLWVLVLQQQRYLRSSAVATLYIPWYYICIRRRQQGDEKDIYKIFGIKFKISGSARLMQLCTNKQPPRNGKKICRFPLVKRFLKKVITTNL